MLSKTTEYSFILLKIMVRKAMTNPSDNLLKIRASTKPDSHNAPLIWTIRFRETIFRKDEPFQNQDS